MELLVNDLSIHGQFGGLPDFRQAIDTLMGMRARARSHGRTIHCHRTLPGTTVFGGSTMQQAVQRLDLNQKRAVMAWLNQNGPFWDDHRQHTSDDYLACGDRIVTDSAVGEAAWRTKLGVDHHLVSVTPSEWCEAPLSVDWWCDDIIASSVNVYNHWTLESLDAALRAAPGIIDSWQKLEDAAVARFQNLTFTPDCFAPLRGMPFIDSASHRILALCGVLDHFRTCFDAQGQRTAEGNRLYFDFFANKGGDEEGGGGAWFTDSSDDEKNTFRQEMTFPNPLCPRESIFCPWHGKIRTGVMRMHFTWPVTASAPLIIAYIGPKITKR